MLNAMFWRSPKNRMLARNALALLLATAPATATTGESDSQSANSIMPGCTAWIAQLSRGSTALGSNVFVAGERLGIVGRNVARMVDAPKASPSPMRALTADQVATFLAAAEASDYYAFFVLAAEFSGFPLSFWILHRGSFSST